MSFSRSFLIAALGLVLSTVLSVAFSLGYSPVAGVLSGTFLGLANFVSLYRFGVRVLHEAVRQPGDASRAGSRSVDKAGVAALGGFALRFPMIVAGLAVVARYFGIGGLIPCTLMLFAVQAPLFVSLGQVMHSGATELRLP